MTSLPASHWLLIKPQSLQGTLNLQGHISTQWTTNNTLNICLNFFFIFLNSLVDGYLVIHLAVVESLKTAIV